MIPDEGERYDVGMEPETKLEPKPEPPKPKPKPGPVPDSFSKYEPPNFDCPGKYPSTEWDKMKEPNKRAYLWVLAKTEELTRGK